MTPAANQSLSDLLESLGSSDFWGSLILRFQHGEVVHITKEESIQPVPRKSGKTCQAQRQ
jgi:hypothetical protein